MRKKRPIPLDFEVDKLTHSIENVVTGDSFQTEVSVVSASDLKHITKIRGWLFNWKYEFKQPNREIYKLTIEKNPLIIQGLISLEIMEDHVYRHLIESASFNRGKSKIYVGIPGNLVSFACKRSFESGFEGNVSFYSKTQLVQHYIETLGIYHAGGRLMIINSTAALKLINKYFPD